MGVAAFLLGNICVGLYRIVLGPTHLDRMLAAQLLGTTGIAVALVLAEATGEGGGRDVALTLAVLAALAAVFFVRRFRYPGGEDRT
ncbi:MAG: multiple resistance and pH regulation protein F [Rhodospirillales bacterium]|nr:multiple resistance and pH regulation protein F [Rhodospirillales bacterium]